MKTEKEYLSSAYGSYLTFPNPKTRWGLKELTIYMERQRSLTYWNRENWGMLLKHIQVMGYLIVTHR